MEAKSSKIDDKKPGLNIRIDPDNEDTIEMLDDSEFPEGFKREVLSPYLRHLYDDLAERGTHPEAGIPKATFLDVTFS